jgi:MoaA/NifB/PqqE/SkfB family radical SAM enzyme
MTPKDLQIYLSSKFDLLSFIDLADLLEQHRTIFDIFKSVYRPVFDPNHRIVFYTSHEPEQDLIDHIQRAAARIDISNSYILIVCPYDIKNKLSTASLRLGDPKFCIESLIIPVIDSLPLDQSRIVKTKTLCPLPFAMLNILSTGDVRPCCYFKSDIGSADKQTLVEIFHGDRAQHIRKQMIRGEAPTECDICWQLERTGNKSLRSHALDKYGDALDQSWLDDVQIRDITWAPTNVCNFKCRICSWTASSRISVEEMKFSNDTQQKILIKSAYIQSTKVMPLIKDQIVNCNSIMYLHLLGGEPFLWPELESLLDDLINAKKSSKIHIEFHTNGSFYNDNLLKKIIHNFASLEIILSIDNIEERFEIERGGSWKKIHQNIKKFAALNGGTTQIKIAPTVNIQNILYLDQIYNFVRDLKLDILWWYLEKPKFLNIDYVTENAKSLIIKKLQDSKVEEIQKIVVQIQHAPMSDGKSFIEYVNKLDARRNQNFRSTHKEIYEAMSVARS